MRVIDADKLEEQVKISDKPAWMIIRDAPTVDAAPVVHSEWEKFYYPSGTHGIRCKNCKERNGRRSNYCPNCGAKMDVGTK